MKTEERDVAKRWFFAGALAAVLAAGGVSFAEGDGPPASVRQGRRFYRQEKYGEAIEVLERALASADDVSERYAALLFLGHSHLHEKQAEKAAGYYRQAAELKGLDGGRAAEARCRLGLALYSLEKFDEAIESFDKAVLVEGARKGTLHRATLSKGNALFQLKRADEARAVFEAIAESQESPAAYRVSALAQLGHMAAAEGDDETAVKYYRRMLDAKGVSPVHEALANLCLGDVYAKANETEKARAAYQAVLDGKAAPERYKKNATKRLEALDKAEAK